MNEYVTPYDRIMRMIADADYPLGDEGLHEMLVRACQSNTGFGDDHEFADQLLINELRALGYPQVTTAHENLGKYFR